jgi:hypothetical protein
MTGAGTRRLARLTAEVSPPTWGQGEETRPPGEELAGVSGGLRRHRPSVRAQLPRWDSRICGTFELARQ